MDKPVDMKQSAAVKEKTLSSSYKPNPYPYGLELSLSHEQLVKLGISELPDAGDEYHITAVGKVTSASTDSNGDGTKMNMRIQITHLMLDENSPEEKAEKPAEDKAEKASFSKPKMSMRKTMPVQPPSNKMNWR